MLWPASTEPWDQMGAETEVLFRLKPLQNSPYPALYFGGLALSGTEAHSLCTLVWLCPLQTSKPSFGATCDCLAWSSAFHPIPEWCWACGEQRAARAHCTELQTFPFPKHPPLFQSFLKDGHDSSCTPIHPQPPLQVPGSEQQHLPTAEVLPQEHLQSLLWSPTVHLQIWESHKVNRLQTNSKRPRAEHGPSNKTQECSFFYLFPQ